MKTNLFLIGLLAMSTVAFSQTGVGIGVADPHPSATLHVQPPSTPKGMLIPRLTTVDRENITAPANGLLVYDTDVKGLMHFNGTWQTVGMPPGAIIMWSGLTPPAGWALCDGTDGRPDLRERFIVGAGTGDNTSVSGTLAYAVGAIDGLNMVTLEPEQMPAHTHVIDNGGLHTHDYQAPLTPGGHPGGNGGYDRPNGLESGTTGDSGSAHSHTMQSAGLGQAHENRPPFYALAFIIKL